MKKMLPDQLGTNIPNNWQEGEYLVLKESWKLQNIYDMEELGVVGFIQHNTSKSVQQAGNSNTEPFAPYYNTDVALTNEGFVAFSLLKETEIEIRLFNQVGREVKKISYDNLSPGNHSVKFDVSDLQTGMYFIQTKIGNQVHTEKISVMK